MLDVQFEQDANSDMKSEWEVHQISWKVQPQISCGKKSISVVALIKWTLGMTRHATGSRSGSQCH